MRSAIRLCASLRSQLMLTCCCREQCAQLLLVLVCGAMLIADLKGPACHTRAKAPALIGGDVLL